MTSLPLEANSSHFAMSRYGFGAMSAKLFSCAVISPTANSARGTGPSSSGTGSRDKSASGGIIVPEREAHKAEASSFTSLLWSKLFDRDATSHSTDTSLAQDDSTMNSDSNGMAAAGTSSHESNTARTAGQPRARGESARTPLLPEEFCFFDASDLDTYMRVVAGPAMSLVADLLSPAPAISLERESSIHQMMNMSNLRERISSER